MRPTITVEIDKFYLLTIACYGNMGDGELPKIMQAWAQKTCKDVGLLEEFNQMQKERLAELRKRVVNVIGEDNMGKVEGEIKMAAQYMGYRFPEGE